MDSGGLRKVSSLLAMAFVFCWGPAKADDPVESNFQVTVAAGSIGGSYYVMNAAMFDVFSKNIEGLIYSIVPGGSVSNPIAINQNDAQCGLSFTNDLKSAVIGQAPYSSPLLDIRAVANVGFEARLHVFIDSDLGLSSMVDLARVRPELRIDTGPRGTGSELAAKRVLDLHGYSYAEIRKLGGRVIHSQFREMVDRMKDGHLNALMYNDLLGAPLFTDLVSSRPVTLISLGRGVIDALARDFGYTPGIIPGGTYRDQIDDVHTIKRHTIFICHKNMPTELIHQMARLIFLNKEDLYSTYRAFNITAEQVASELPIALHPGAERFYREAGIAE
jgi:TRAP transporter TAXI family solute receptor